MKKDRLIDIWQEGNERLFRDQKTDKEMITKYLSEKTLKGTRSISFNIFFYGIIQIVNLVLLSLNLAGYAGNPTMIWILVAQVIVTIGIMVYGMDLFIRFRDINNYSESLHNLITRQLRFYKRPYEWWLVLSSVSALILINNLNLYVDNDNGTYAINNKLFYIGVSIGVLVFIYGTLKLASLHGLHSLKAYLSDLQSGVLDQSDKLERTRRKLIWVYAFIALLLTITMVLGLLKYLSLGQ